MSHYKVLCKHCYKIMEQCRCMAKEKEIRYEECDACKGKVIYVCDRRVYMIFKDDDKSDPYPFIGTYEEFLDYYKWYGKNNRIAMARLSYDSLPVAEVKVG